MDYQCEIKYLSRLIRYEISKANTTSVRNFDHGHEIQRGFWSYCKRVLDVKGIILPLFDKDFHHGHEIQRGFWSYCKRVLDVKGIILPLFDKETVHNISARSLNSVKPRILTSILDTTPTRACK